jgi:ABC-type sugar transport system ATPase subunit
MLKVNSLNIQHLYGQKAIQNLSFQVEKGQTLCILADGEGGKTSLLKAIAGLVRVESGNVVLNCKDITNLKPKDRGVAIVLSNEGIFNFKTVKSHLKMPLKLRKLPRVEAVVKTSTAFNLYHLLGDLGRQLYEDDKVRLKFARAFICPREVILIDNVFNNLLGNEREKLFFEMLPHIKSANAPVIFATNSLNEALMAGDYVLVLDYGNLVCEGTPDEILKNPHQTVKEKFISRFGCDTINK